jgi:CBS domain-containing protein
MEKNSRHGEMARDVMSPNPTTVNETEMLDKVAQLMKREDTGVIPVCDSSKKVIGMVTDRDIVVRVVADGGNPSSTAVKQIMSKDVTCVRENDSLDSIFKVMSEKQIRRVPVVNEREEIVGIIAQADLATRSEHDRKLGETVEQISR